MICRNGSFFCHQVNLCGSHGYPSLPQRGRQPKTREGHPPPMTRNFRGISGSVENLQILTTLLGLRPAAVGAPVAIMLYYPDRDFPGTTEESYAPPPPTGAGMAQGGLKIFKKGFLQSRISSTF